MLWQIVGFNLDSIALLNAIGLCWLIVVDIVVLCTVRLLRLNAFTDKIFDEMKKVWMQSESVQCIHPSHEALVGYKNVMASWKGMFDSDVKNFQMNSMVPYSIRLSVKGCTALLTHNVAHS